MAVKASAQAAFAQPCCTQAVLWHSTCKETARARGTRKNWCVEMACATAANTLDIKEFLVTAATMSANMPSAGLLLGPVLLWKLYCDLEVSRRPANSSVDDLGQRLLVR